MRERLERERRELLAYWQDALASHRWYNTPMRRLRARGQDATAMDIRKVHDAIGWGAKNPIRCRGAIYRTGQFIMILPERRDARRPRNIPREQHPRNMHIEHTTLASQLYAMYQQRGPASLESDFRFLIDNGIATAMHVGEERALGGNYRAINNAFDETHDDFDLPFRRYALLHAGGTVIWNIVTGEQVDPDRFTFADHRATVERLLREAGPLLVPRV